MTRVGVLVLIALIGSDSWAEDRPEESRPLGTYEGLLPFGIRGLPAGSSASGSELHARTRTAVDDALGWLACHQDPNGVFDVGDLSWADGERISVLPGAVKETAFLAPVHALVLCAFLGAGYGPSGDHPFARPVRDGLEALARLLGLDAERADDRYVRRRDPTYVMSHAFALRAFAEAFASTGAERYRSFTRRLLKSLLDARASYSGWGYAHQDGSTETFLSACIAFSLDAVVTVNRAATLANLPPPLLVKHVRSENGAAVGVAGIDDWFGRVVDPKSGAVGYRKRGEPGTTRRAAGRPVRTSPLAAVAMAHWFSQRQVGSRPPKSRVRAWRKNLISTPTWSPSPPTHDLIEWWFIGMALAADTSHRAEKWRVSMAAHLLENQVTEGSREDLRGSWAPTGKWGFASGRIGTTALSVLCLVAAELTPVLDDPPDGRTDLSVEMLRESLRPELRADLLVALARFDVDGASTAAASHVEHDTPLVRRAARLALELADR